MLDDISKSLRTNLYERTSSPLFGAFIVSWLIWNYKTLLVIFSSLSVDKKINFIETNIYGADWSLLLGGVIYPLMSAIVFILVYPYPAQWIYRYWHNQQKVLKQIRQQIEDETPLTVEEARLLRREHYRLATHYDEQLSKRNVEIDRLKEIIKSLENELTEKEHLQDESSPKPEPETDSDIDDSLTEEQKEILFDIGKQGGEIINKEYISKSKLEKVKVEYYLEDLEQKSYVKSYFRYGMDSRTVKLTTKGKRFVVEEGGSRVGK